MEGHRYFNCKSKTKKCINCHQNHSTLAFKCPKRKEQQKQKIKEIRQKKKSPPSEKKDTTAEEIQSKLTDNYLAVITSAITLATIRERECPGTFNYIISEMYRANSVPNVIFPGTVIVGYENYAEKRDKKRNREEEDMEEEELVEVEVRDRSPLPKMFRTESGSLVEVLVAPTPRNTPMPSPNLTPISSPKGSEQGVKPKAKPPPKQSQTLQEDPDIVLMAPEHANIFPKTHLEKLYYLKKAQKLKYIYQNTNCQESDVWEAMMEGKVDLTGKKIYYVDRKKYDKVANGQNLDLNRYMSVAKKK